MSDMSWLGDLRVWPVCVLSANSSLALDDDKAS